MLLAGGVSARLGVVLDVETIKGTCPEAGLLAASANGPSWIVVATTARTSMDASVEQTRAMRLASVEARAT
jgi:hypothetical protein